MSFLMLLPLVLHVYLMRKEKRRCFIEGGLAMVLTLIAIVWRNPYMYATLLLLYLFVDTQHSYVLCGVLLVVILMSWSRKPALLYWVTLMLLLVVYHETTYHSYEQQLLAYQNKVLQRQVKEVETMFMTMRGWRHDYHNHLQNLKVKLRKGELQESMAYLDELEVELQDIRLLVESGNTNMDAILNSKLSLALHQDIDLHVKAKVPAQLPISDTDICALLGNLIDNALEACEKVAEKRFLRLYINQYKGQLYISCTNATKETIRKLDAEYVSHKRGNHGHGLKRMNQVVEKYGGSIVRRNEPGVFTTEILLPLL